MQTIDWEKWSDFFECEWGWFLNKDKAYPRLNHILPATPQHLDYRDDYEHLEDENREAVEKAVRKFAKTKKWPKMSKVVGSLARERVQFASSLASNMQYLIKALKLGPAKRRMTEEQTILWFLIEAWNKFGFEGECCPLANVPIHEAPPAPQINRLSADFGKN